MKRRATIVLGTLLAAACGSSPSTPTEAPVAAARGVSLSIRLAPDSDPVKGWPSPVSVTLQARDGVSPAVIVSAALRMLDASGRVLAEAAIAIGDPIPQGAYLNGDVVVQTLAWPIEQGQGKRIDGSLTFRGASGDLRTVPLSLPAR